MSLPFTTGLPVDNHRVTSPAAVATFARTVGASPDVDYLWFWDEMTGWFHRSLWKPENAPAAAVLDNNSTHDALVEAAFALGANPAAGARITTGRPFAPGPPNCIGRC
ncbi:hypothetical protein [Actinoplanes sp. NPDC049265]|uniref:hypothetical protein n=1 Tax=Actinoplanes sp. NPDC049265 TaxID=3363902 RepID=UPI00371B7B03